MSSIGKAKHFLQRFKRAQRGTTAVIFGIVVIPLLAFSGSVVDYGHAVKTKSQLVSTLDAALLAAMKEYSIDKSVDYKSVVADFVNENLSKSNKSYHGLELNITVPDISDEGEMKAFLTTDVSTNFLKLVGFNKFSINVASAVVVGGKNLEVVLVLDNTGSMFGSKIETLKNSATDLVDMLMLDNGEDRVQMALVPFAEYVNIGVGMRNESGLEIPADYTDAGTGIDYKWYGCMGSRKPELEITDENYATPIPGMMMFEETDVPFQTPTPFESGRCPNSSIVGLTLNKSAITAGIADMTAEGWTYIPGGLSWGGRVLSNQAPFTAGLPDDDKSVQKVIVLMTDGSNTRAQEKWTNEASAQHSAEVWGHSVHEEDGAGTAANLVTENMCNNIKARKIVVFTIVFDVEEGSDVQTLMQACAGNGGQYFDASNNSELEQAFKEIGFSLLNMRLSQ